jgi:hypothetical protein
MNDPDKANGRVESTVPDGRDGKEGDELCHFVFSFILTLELASK